jgi:hypothetical protein
MEDGPAHGAQWGRISMDFVQHHALHEHARMVSHDGSLKISEGSTVARCFDSDVRCLDAKAPEGSKVSWDGNKDLVIQWLWLYPREFLAGRIHQHVCQ